MTKGWKRTLGVAVILGIAMAVVLLWPATDPLADVETVAVRVGETPSTGSAIDFESELRVILGERNIRIVSNEQEADVVLALDDLIVNLGDIEISISNGGFRGRASAVCTLTDVRSGTSHVMDFRIEVGSEGVKAELVPRRFWEFWKPQPSG